MQVLVLQIDIDDADEGMKFDEGERKPSSAMPMPVDADYFADDGCLFLQGMAASKTGGIFGVRGRHEFRVYGNDKGL